MTTLVDTSALYALLDEKDPNHQTARAWFHDHGPRQALLSHSYVVVESTALIHRRFGNDAVRTLLDDLIPPVTIVYVDERLHRAATSTFLATLKREVSLVDHVSFELMRHHAIDQAFAFDADFAKRGFATVP